MGTYFATFGQQYPREPHPAFPLAHRDGWVTVVGALNEAEAREVVMAMLGPYWSGLYSEDTFGDDAGMYPLGELARLDVAEVLHLDVDDPAQPDPSCVRCGGTDSPCPACNPRVRMEP